MDNDIAVSVQNVTKNFKLPHEKVDSLKSLFVHPFKNRKKVKLQHALKDISFDVKKGEFFGIVGRNGSGKSTLLKLIAGIYRPTKGSISVDGRLVPFIELGVGFNPELTGKENVFLNGALMGFSRKEITAKYKSIVDFAELERFMDQKLKNYSSGMQVRLAFSVATVLAESDVLLIDEVLAVGDADFQRKCFEYFKSLKQNDKTVIFVSHDMTAVREYCDRAALVEGGKIVDIGETDRVAQRYAELFIENLERVESSDEFGSRWGTGDIKTMKLRATVGKGVVTFEQTVKSFVPAENPIVGFRIRSAKGEGIAGTNSKIEGFNTGKFEANEQKSFHWTMPSIFADGEYYIDPAVIDEDNVTVHDWWDGAVKFGVKKLRALPYATDPGFKVKILKK